MKLQLLVQKWSKTYSSVRGFTNAHLSIALVRASHLCLRGSRIPASALISYRRACHHAYDRLYVYLRMYAIPLIYMVYHNSCICVLFSYHFLGSHFNWPSGSKIQFYYTEWYHSFCMERLVILSLSVAAFGPTSQSIGGYKYIIITCSTEHCNLVLCWIGTKYKALATCVSSHNVMTRGFNSIFRVRCLCMRHIATTAWSRFAKTHHYLKGILYEPIDNVWSKSRYSMIEDRLKDKKATISSWIRKLMCSLR